MLRHSLATGFRLKLMIVLLLGAIALAAPAVTPDPAAADEQGCQNVGIDTNRTLKRGSRGVDVAHAQCLLNSVTSGDGRDIAVDGIFGKETRKDVKQVQRNAGLKVDGIIGTCTWGLLHGDPIPEACFPGGV